MKDAFSKNLFMAQASKGRTKIYKLVDPDLDQLALIIDDEMSTSDLVSMIEGSFTASPTNRAYAAGTVHSTYTLVFRKRPTVFIDRSPG